MTAQEMKYRGKGKITGGWLYGDKLTDQISGEAAIVSYVNLSGNVTDLSEINIYAVHPETLGRSTGITDKNVKEIFEGDIRKHYNHIDDPTRFDIGKVFWDEKNARFLRTTKNGDTCFLCTDMSYPYEVIGNIHDNPELLKGDNDDESN